MNYFYMSHTTILNPIFWDYYPSNFLEVWGRPFPVLLWQHPHVQSFSFSRNAQNLICKEELNRFSVSQKALPES